MTRISYARGSWCGLGDAKRSVLITGTSTGIGEATARVFLEKGWTVFASVRKDSDAERLSNLGPNLRPVLLDVTKQTQIDEAFAKIGAQVGEQGLDALVNNAGYSLLAPIEFFPIEEVQRQFDVNVFGVIRITQAALPLLRRGSPGRIVNVSSVTPEVNAPLAGIYSATKSALDLISESTRRELAEWGIKVSSVKPGPVKTNFQSSLLQRVGVMMETTPQCQELYGKAIENLPEVYRKLEEIGIGSPSNSAAVIYEAVVAKHPKNFYWDTWKTWLSMTMMAWMPKFILDGLHESLYKPYLSSKG